MTVRREICYTTRDYREEGFENKMKRQTILMAALFAGLAACAERQPYSHYQTIVDRQMFGPLPEDFDPTKLPSEAKSSQKQRGKQAENLTKEQEKLKSAVRFSVLNVTPGGAVKVGFTDNSDRKAPRNYYLGVGETRDGWVVKEADPDAATMTIEKGEVEITLTIGGDSAKSEKATTRAGAANAARPGGPTRSRLLNTKGLTRKERRQRTEEELAELKKAQAEDEERRAAEKAEQDAKREEDKQSLQTMRTQLESQLEAMRRKIQDQRPPKPQPDESQEDGNDANNDSE